MDPQLSPEMDDDDDDILFIGGILCVLTAAVHAHVAAATLFVRHRRRAPTVPRRVHRTHTITPLIEGNDRMCTKLLGMPWPLVELIQGILRPMMHPRGGLTVLDQITTFLLWMWQYPRLSLLSAVSGNIGETTTCRIIDKMLTAFVTTFAPFIHMSAPAARPQFILHHSLIGVLDGTALGIRRPTLEEERFYRGDKHRHFVSMLILCNPDGFITWVGVGYPGHNNDQANYSLSALARWIHGSGNRILTDGGFFGEELIRPVIRPTDSILFEYFNHLVQDERAIIEHVNADVKEFEAIAQRFRGNRMQLTQAAISACILHNMKVLWARS